MNPGWWRARASLIALAFILAGTNGCQQPWRETKPPTGDAVIRGPGVDGEIVITTTSRLAGAVHSLRWQGREFIDSTDHGRQLQSASNFDAGRNPIQAETFNPTEAGSRQDHIGPSSSSRLQSFRTFERGLESVTQMAFWLAPGEKSSGHPARNQTVLSNHILRKRIEIGGPVPGSVLVDVVFQVPDGEDHRHGVFESLTGYLPAEFSRFWCFDPARAKLVPLDDGPGEQTRPVVLATADGDFAMGIWSPERGARYGRFRFTREKVVKWNCVFRRGDNEHPLPAGDYAFRHVVLVGSLTDVEKALRQLSVTGESPAIR
jgi:hypothetical protein